MEERLRKIKVPKVYNSKLNKMVRAYLPHKKLHIPC